jgi:DNA end-binding protein Ku
VPGHRPGRPRRDRQGLRGVEGPLLSPRPEEIESVKLESRKTLDLVQFVDEDDIDATYFEKPYYVVPADDLAEEAYVVLRDALKAAKKVGVGQLAMRGQEYVVALKPCGRGLLLETLRYADEVHKSSGFFRDIGDHKPDPDLLDMASMLIERKAGEFDPKEFHNRYVDALHHLIEEKQKRKGEKIIEEPDQAPPKGSNVIDLMAALKKSLGDQERGKAEGGRAKKQAAKKCAAQRRNPKERAQKGAKSWPSASARHRDLQPEARLHEDEGAAGPQAQGQGRQLRRPEA